MHLLQASDTSRNCYGRNIYTVIKSIVSHAYGSIRDLVISGTSGRKHDQFCAILAEYHSVFFRKIRIFGSTLISVRLDSDKPSTKAASPIDDTFGGIVTDFNFSQL